MRRLIPIVVCLFLLVACNNSESTTVKDEKSDSATADIAYAYTTRNKPNWEIGNPANVAILLNALKAFETGKLDELNQYFADSVEFSADYVYFHGKRDSLLNIFRKDWETMQSMTVEMNDWETVHGKDNNEDWVSIWYKAKWVGKDGKTDSSFFMDDAKIVNGKIRELDSKQRRFPKTN